MQMSRHLLFLTLAVLVVGGCKCPGGNGPTTAQPDFIASPTVLSFESCPTEDENGAPVADVFPAVQTFTIENIGRVSGPLFVTLQGKDAALFKVLEDTLVPEVGSGETVELQPESRLRLGDGEALVDAAIAGLGIAQVPDYMVADAHGAGRVVEVLREFRAPPYPISVVYPPSRMLPPRVRVLIDALSERGAAKLRIRLG